MVSGDSGSARPRLAGETRTRATIAPLSGATADSVPDIMPSAQLVRYEWSTHRTCGGLTPDDEMGSALKIRIKRSAHRGYLVSLGWPT